MLSSELVDRGALEDHQQEGVVLLVQMETIPRLAELVSSFRLALALGVVGAAARVGGAVQVVGQAQTFLLAVVERVDTTLLVALATMVTLVHKGAAAVAVRVELPLMMGPYPILVRIHPDLAMLQVAWRQVVRVGLV